MSFRRQTVASLMCGLDWRSEQRGIYCVLWFGDLSSTTNRRLKAYPDGPAAPQSAEEMRTLLIDRIPEARRTLIDVLVLELTAGRSRCRVSCPLRKPCATVVLTVCFSRFEPHSCVSETGQILPRVRTTARGDLALRLAVAECRNFARRLTTSAASTSRGSLGAGR
jgi:hypothetical protein